MEEKRRQTPIKQGKANSQPNHVVYQPSIKQKPHRSIRLSDQNWELEEDKRKVRINGEQEPNSSIKQKPHRNIRFSDQNLEPEEDKRKVKINGEQERRVHQILITSEQD